MVNKKEIYGDMHRGTQHTKTVLVECYEKLGMEEEAEELLREVGFMREAGLGPEHDETIESKRNMLSSY